MIKVIATCLVVFFITKQPIVTITLLLVLQSVLTGRTGLAVAAYLAVMLLGMLGGFGCLLLVGFIAISTANGVALRTAQQLIGTEE